MLSIVGVFFGVLGLSILFSFAPPLFSGLFSVFKQTHICKLLRSPEKEGDRHLTLLPPPAPTSAPHAAGPDCAVPSGSRLTGQWSSTLYELKPMCHVMQI